MGEPWHPDPLHVTDHDKKRFEHAVEHEKWSPFRPEEVKGKLSPLDKEDKKAIEKADLKDVKQKVVEKVVDEEKKKADQPDKRRKEEKKEGKKGDEGPLKKKLEDIKEKQTFSEKTFMTGVRQMYFLDLMLEEEEAIRHRAGDAYDYSAETSLYDHHYLQ